jgi:hypothetical protein
MPSVQPASRKTWSGRSLPARMHCPRRVPHGFSFGSGGQAMHAIARQIRALGVEAIEATREEAAARTTLGLRRFSDPDGLPVEVHRGPCSIARCSTRHAASAGARGWHGGIGCGTLETESISDVGIGAGHYAAACGGGGVTGPPHERSDDCILRGVAIVVKRRRRLRRAYHRRRNQLTVENYRTTSIWGHWPLR